MNLKCVNQIKSTQFTKNCKLSRLEISRMSFNRVKNKHEKKIETLFHSFNIISFFHYFIHHRKDFSMIQDLK